MFASWHGICLLITTQARWNTGLVDTVEYGGVPNRIVVRDTGDPVSRTMLMQASMIRETGSDTEYEICNADLFVNFQATDLKIFAKLPLSSNNSSKPPTPPPRSPPGCSRTPIPQQAHPSPEQSPARMPQPHNLLASSCESSDPRVAKAVQSQSPKL